MSKIVRTPTRAEGGITEDEKKQMDLITQKWIKNAFRTEPINKDKITKAIKDLYKVSGLKEPRVVVAPSPYVMALAYGLASGIWQLRGVNKLVNGATHDATYDATRAATYVATDGATDDATHDATYGATRTMSWLHDLALHFGGNEENAKVLIGNISRWYSTYQGGNMWSYFGAYAEAMRDVIGLTGLDCWDKYQPWEDAMKEGGFRVMHEEFCIVSDFPKTLLVDEQNRSHCDSGPSHEWRDGFKIYHLHGVKFDEEMHRKLTSGDFTLEELATNTNMTADQRAEALFWLPPEKLLKQVKAELIHTGIKGTKLYHVPEILDAKDQYCMLMEHPTIKGRFFIEWVDPEVGKLKDADLAQCYAWQDEDGDPIPLEDYLNAIEA